MSSEHAHTLGTGGAEETGVRTLITYLLIHPESIIRNRYDPQRKEVLAARGFALEKIKQGYDPLPLGGC